MERCLSYEKNGCYNKHDLKFGSWKVMGLENFCYDFPQSGKEFYFILFDENRNKQKTKEA